jgi:ParE toxin of type II toxin-antitoxin system, parDE
MHQIILKPRAILMAKDAYDWYEGQSKGLGEIFLDELDNCFKKLRINPARSPKIIKNYRQAGLKRFPYVVLFEIHKTDIVVLSVFHTKRNPKYKFNK